jgi:SNF2 family DNA or RNA helicase
VRGKIKRVVGLTGTPISNGLLDLWSQIFLLDEGKSLGANYYGYLNRYFVSLLEINGRTVKWGIRPDNANKIKMAIKPFCLSMQAKDYLNLPQRIDNYIDVYPLEKEHELFLSILNSTTKEELDELVLTGKRLQFANGAVYTTETEYTIIHDHKTDALKEMLEVENEPVIIFYQYKHDLQRISALLRHDFKNKKVSTLETAQDVQNWNLGLTGVLLLHPASAGHGLNLQQGGNKIIWFGLTWSLELYQQANARLHRQGQTKPTFIHHIISKGTIDEVVIKALQTKGITQSEVLEAIKNG